MLLLLWLFVCLFCVDAVAVKCWCCWYAARRTQSYFHRVFMSFNKTRNSFSNSHCKLYCCVSNINWFCFLLFFHNIKLVWCSHFMVVKWHETVYEEHDHIHIEKKKGRKKERKNNWAFYLTPFLLVHFSHGGAWKVSKVIWTNKPNKINWRFCIRIDETINRESLKTIKLCKYSRDLIV